MALKAVTGTFSAIGTSATLSTDMPAMLSLTFAGVGSVTLQRRLNGVDWKDVETFTASAERDIGHDQRTLSAVDYRLNCTDATATVDYDLRS